MRMLTRNVNRIGLIAPSILAMVCAWTISVQAQCTGSNVTTGDDYRVRDVKVETLLGSAPPTLKEALAKHRGEKYSTSGEEDLITTGASTSGPSRERYIHEVKDFFGKAQSEVSQDRRVGINKQNALYVRASYIKTCVKIVPVAECEADVKDDHGRPFQRCLDIIVKIKVVPINTESLSANLLDLARSNKLRFYRQLPKGLRIFNPTFWIDYDREYGTSAVVNSVTDIGELVAPDGDKKNPVRITQVHLAVAARKSLQNRFYDTSSVLTVAHTAPLDTLSALGVNASFSASEQPQGENLKLINSARIGATAILKLPEGPFSKISLALNYRHANNRLYDRVGMLAEHNAEHAFESRALVDGKIARGFFRGAVWFDGASRERSLGSYRRVAATIGYAKEFVLSGSQCRIALVNEKETCEFPSTNAPAFGVETLFGAGRASGNVPEYARFYGGNSAGNFLYDAINEAAPLDMPNGPLIRSFGRNKAGTRSNLTNQVGGTFYWHYNMSLAIPLRKLSRPLIPAELFTAVPDDSGHLSCSGCSSLKDALKNQVDGEKNMFIDAMAVRKMTPEQREDLALEDDPDNPLTPEEKARLVAADKIFEEKRQEVTPEADRVWKRITPTIEYIADHANLYAIRPLITFDAARISDRNIPDQRTRIALGGGLQLNIVVAKFEVGYVHTVRRMPGDQRGNFNIRMVFEKLF